MKIILTGFVVLGMMLTGCNRVTVNPLTITSEPRIPIPATKTVESGKPFVPVNTDGMAGFNTNASSALAPAQVEIGNMYSGATAEFQIAIHNGDGLKNKILQITTDSNETFAAIPLTIVLSNSGLLDIISIDSQLLVRDVRRQWIPDLVEKETLEAIAYDAPTQLLTIKGFKPLRTRYVKITYRTLSKFTYYYRYPDKTRVGFEYPPILADTWISFDKPSAQLRPMENGSVLVSLKIPADAKVSEKKWEFWIGMMESGVGQSSQISTEIELCSRILVTMR
jgi:hypothetical protein